MRTENLIIFIFLILIIHIIFSFINFKIKIGDFYISPLCLGLELITIVVVSIYFIFKD